ncbi:g803 [Coccomyxa elongata]
MYLVKTAFDSWDRLTFSHQDGIIARDAESDGDCLFTESNGRLVSASGAVIRWAWRRKSGTVLTFCVFIEYLNVAKTLFRLKIGLPDTYLRLESGVLSIGDARDSPICIFTAAKA